MTPIQSSGYLHQSWKPNAIGTGCEESHKKEVCFTLSTILEGSNTAFLKTQLFLSFQITQQQANQMTLR
jgi:5-carboxymethyl-2-hydroxymuconate isomerase